ncbi:ABC transporter permease DevC [Coleofasciculus chthonoplastes]|jgi:putative ABC transport system permease protein|uniref:ABC transporter permease DevC n=1 Tax=Coleofasciculus chthonoplastes TaxID=64178 RepID=UPI0032FD6EF6
MLGLIKTLQQRTPLGLLQLKHDRMRLLTAIAGITFADVLIFMQLGFADALYRTNTQYPRTLQADLVVISTQAKNFGQLRTFTRRRLYQAQDVPGVASADALYLGSVQWRNPKTRKKTSMLLIGQNPDRPAFNLPEVNQQLDAIRLPDTVLFDQASRGEYQDMITQIEQGESATTEIGQRTITVAGLFQVGASFADDGALITSDQNFLRLFPKRDAGSVSLGLIRLHPGYEPEQVRDALVARLPEDVQVLTSQGYVDFEIADIQSRSPIGFVFGLGTIMGLIVGTVIVYQVLSTDVNSHLEEYATFKAMGYRNTYLLGVIFEEALILSVLGFIPGLAIALAAYQVTAAATALPLAMPLSRTIFVLLLTFIMCGASGAIATRRLQAADPADIF